MTAIRLSALLAALFLLAAVHVAQDAPAKPAVTPIKPQELYKLKGRTWSHTVTQWDRGEAPKFKTENGRVTESNDETVSWEIKGTTPDGDPLSQSWEMPTNLLPLEGRAWADEKLPEETLDTGFARFACRKHVQKVKGIQTTTWVSAEYHPLIVKQVKLGKDTCEIRKLKSFDSREQDDYALFRVAGRAWSLRMQSAGEAATFANYRVTTVDAASATVEGWTSDAQGKDVGERESAQILFDGKPPQGDVGWTHPAALIEAEMKLEDVEVEVDAGKFAAKREPASGFEMSSQWPGLILNAKSGDDALNPDGSITLTAFDLGHDAMKLYRKVGNYSVIKTTTQVGGMNIESIVRYEVLSVADGKAKLKFTTSGQGNDFEQETEMDVPEAEAPFMPYDGQIEESITTPAGTFRCIKTEIHGGTIMWMHHGVMVKSTITNDNMEMTQELIELKLE